MDQQSKQKRPYFYKGQEKLPVLWSYLGYRAKVSYKRTQLMFNLVNNVSILHPKALPSPFRAWLQVHACREHGLSPAPHTPIYISSCLNLYFPW